MAERHNPAFEIAKLLKSASQEERRELMRLVTAEMAKERWRKTNKEKRVQIMRQVAAGGVDAKPKPRCPCGVMTLKRGLSRGHVVLDMAGQPTRCKPV
jgi:hypothetical protein